MYHHVQRAPWSLLLLALGVVQAMSAGLMPMPASARWILAAAAVVMLLLAAAFRELTVRDDSAALIVQFGPLPLLRRRVPFDDMQSATRGRTTWLDGWGVHISPRGGWTWNIWGYDCVDVQLSRGRMIHIGTDDPAVLEAFLQERITNSHR